MKKIQVKIDGEWEDITFFESDSGQFDLHDPRQKKYIRDIRLVDESDYETSKRLSREAGKEASDKLHESECEHGMFLTQEEHIQQHKKELQEALGSEQKDHIGSDIAETLGRLVDNLRKRLEIIDHLNKE